MKATTSTAPTDPKQVPSYKAYKAACDRLTELQIQRDNAKADLVDLSIRGAGQS